MQEIEHSKNILKKIYNDNLEFKVAIKEEQLSDTQNIGVITSLTGCVLRHYYLLERLLKKIDLNEDEKICASIVLANNLFYKHYDRLTANEYLKKCLKEKYDFIKDLTEYDGQISDIFGNEINHDSLEYCAMRFNVPQYLLKMWIKHYGKGLTFKILKRNIKQTIQFLRVNTLKTTEDEILRNYDGLVQTDIQNLLKVEEKINLKKLSAYRNYEIFNEKYPIKKTIDEVFNTNIEYALIYSDKDDSIVNELYVMANKTVGLSIAVPSLDERGELLKLMRLEKCKNVNLFEAYDFSEMNAAITTKQDLIVVMPKSSSFDKIRISPDYLLHFNRNSFDELIAHQKVTLDAFSEYVIEGGKLVYIVDTLNKKESVGVISEFLSHHPDFVLVNSKQYLSFEKCDALFFAAILERKLNDD